MRRLKSPRWLIGVFVAAAGLGGCATVAPPPAAEMSAAALPNARVPGRYAGEASPAASVANAAAGWLADFADPALTALVAEAMAYNSDLRIAAARVEAAEANLAAASGQRLPSVGLTGLYSGSAAPSGGGLNALFLNASLELDLWGRVRYETAAARSESEAATADAAFARQSLAAMVARAWFLAIEAGISRELAQVASANAQNLVRLARERERVGIGNGLDVADAEAAAAGYRDAIARSDFTRDQAVRALEQLVGRYPAAELQVADRLPALPGPVPVGLPSELLERRPDVVAAERRVAAAFNRVGEARAARLPRIHLTTGLSVISSDLLVLQDSENPSFGFGANMFAPLFNHKALKAQVEIRGAEQRVATAAYAETALRAFGEVEDALGAEFALGARHDALEAVEAHSLRSAALASARYRIGSADLRAVEQRQLALYEARVNLVRVRTEQLAQRVNLHLALGGAFDAG